MNINLIPESRMSLKCIKLVLFQQITFLYLMILKNCFFFKGIFLSVNLLLFFNNKTKVPSASLLN